jgi:hypothetical protein
LAVGKDPDLAQVILGSQSDVALSDISQFTIDSPTPSLAGLGLLQNSSAPCPTKRPCYRAAASEARYD